MSRKGRKPTARPGRPPGRRRVRDDKRDERERPKVTNEEGIFIVQWGPPMVPVSVRSHLNALYAATFPHEFIPAGQYCVPRPPAEVVAALEELETATRKMAAVRAGAARGRQEAHEARRAAADQEALLAAVRAYRARHPQHGRPAIA